MTRRPSWVLVLSLAAVAAVPPIGNAGANDDPSQASGSDTTVSPKRGRTIWEIFHIRRKVRRAAVPAAAKQEAIQAPASSSRKDTLALNTGLSLSDMDGLGGACGANFFRCTDHVGCFKYALDCGERHGPVKPACCCLDHVVAQAEASGWSYVGSFGQEGWCRENCRDLCRKEARKQGLELIAARCIGCTKGSCPKYVIGYSKQEWDGLGESTRQFMNQVGRNANGYSSGSALCPSGDEDCFCQF